MARTSTTLKTIALLLVGMVIGRIAVKEVQASGIIQSAYNLIQDEGSNLTRRQTLNFVGSSVTCADGSSKTTCTFTGSSTANYTQSFTNQTSVVLAHNLSSTAIVVQCFNSASPAVNIEWDTLTLTDANDATVTFSSSQSGSCVVSGGAGGANGSFVLIEEHTASSSASLNFTTCIGATYDDYQIHFVDLVPATNTDNFLLRVSTNGGASYDAGANYSWGAFAFRPGASATAGGTGQTAVSVSGGFGVGNDAHFGESGILNLYAPGSTTAFKRTSSHMASFDGTFRESVVEDGAYESVTAVNAFQVLASSGNLASGVVRCYGVAK